MSEHDNTLDLETAHTAGEAFARGDLRIQFDPDVRAVEVPPRELAEEPTEVVTSLRLPSGLHDRLKTAAKARGTSMGALLRDGAEMILADLDDQPISRADALRLLASLPPVGGGHAA